MLAPELALLLQQRPVDPAALPQGVVGILDRQRRQWIVLAVDEGAVERAEFAQQHADRPTIGNQMMQGHQQQVVVFGQLQQACAQERAMFQLEGSAGFLFGVTLCGGLRIGAVAQVDALQWHGDVRRSDHLGGAGIGGDEVGA